MMLEKNVELDRQDWFAKQLSGMVDVWMAFEHREAWESAQLAKQAREQEQEEDVVDLTRINADDMSSLMDKIRRINGEGGME